jgi:hypothetical protein
MKNKMWIMDDWLEQRVALVTSVFEFLESFYFVRLLNLRTISIPIIPMWRWMKYSSPKQNRVWVKPQLSTLETGIQRAAGELAMCGASYNFKWLVFVKIVLIGSLSNVHEFILNNLSNEKWGVKSICGEGYLVQLGASRRRCWHKQ